MAMQHLIALGHKQIAYCFGKNPDSWARHRLCADIAVRNDLPSPALCESVEDLKRQLDSSHRPSAIVAYSDLHAVQAIHVAKTLALDIPQDLSIIGFDDLFFSAWPEFSLTTISQPKQEIGLLAAEMLLSQIDGNGGSDILLPPSLIVRNSCCKPKD